MSYPSQDGFRLPVAPRGFRWTAHILIALLVSLGGATAADAWGERGHAIVSRVAARLIAARVGPGVQPGETFGRKELMLAHLSNVPDIVWRSMGKQTEDVNAPTHFLDLELLGPSTAFEALPKTLAEAEERMRQLCASPPAGYVCGARAGQEVTESLAGSAPWRVAQLFKLMTESFAKVPVPAGTTVAGRVVKLDAAAADQALLYAGLLSHFVGDLGNPHHSTRDYDGWERGQGGIHGYFERDIVNSYELSLEQEVYQAARRGRLFERVLSRIPAGSRGALDPKDIAFALTLDSHARLADLNAIDRRFALVTPSRPGTGAERVAAERRSHFTVKARFHDMVTQRLATAADTLAHLWLLGWERAGKPDLAGYQSYAYPVTPEFVQPDYLKKTP